MQTRPVDEEQQKRNMQDPEIQALVNDATMQQALKELSENPKGSRVLEDPRINKGFQMLVAAGIIRYQFTVCCRNEALEREVHELDESHCVWKRRIRDCHRGGDLHRAMRWSDRRDYRVDPDHGGSHLVHFSHRERENACGAGSVSFCHSHR